MPRPRSGPPCRSEGPRARAWSGQPPWRRPSRRGRRPPAAEIRSAPGFRRRSPSDRQVRSAVPARVRRPSFPPLLSVGHRDGGAHVAGGHRRDEDLVHADRVSRIGPGVDRFLNGEDEPPGRRAQRGLGSLMRVDVMPAIGHRGRSVRAHVQDRLSPLRRALDNVAADAIIGPVSGRRGLLTGTSVDLAREERVETPPIRPRHRDDEHDHLR